MKELTTSDGEANIPDGNYGNCHWGGWKVSVGGQSFTTKIGVKCMKMPVMVIVKNKIAYVYENTNKSSRV